MAQFVSRTRSWVEQRTGLVTAVGHFLREEIPASTGWPQVFGSIALFIFLIQALTGTLLALNYAATPGEAYTSLSYIVHSIAGGRLIHGLHHWGASWMIVVVFLHMSQVFIYGAYKRPREVTWIAGVLLLLLTLAFGLTGYLLPWDNRAYWGTVVTAKILDGVPIAGSLLTNLIGATNGIGVVTFARFYAFHTLLLPIFTVTLIVLHVYLVRLHGVTPSRTEHGPKEVFYPKQLFRDFAAVFVVFLSLFLAAAFLDVPLGRMADPTDSAFIPRPEWYFLFLFQLLKVFPGRLELLGTVVLPTLAVLALAMLPFFDSVHNVILNSKVRAGCVVILVFAGWFGLTTAAGWSTPDADQSRRSFATAQWAQVSPNVIVGFGKFGALKCNACHNLLAGPPKLGPNLGVKASGHPREWVVEHFNQEHGQTAASQHFSSDATTSLLALVSDLNPESIEALRNMSPHFVRGAEIYVNSGCPGCHTIDGEGGRVGPPLDGLATRRNKVWVDGHFQNPNKYSPGSTMPPFSFSSADKESLISYLFSLPQ